MTLKPWRQIALSCLIALSCTTAAWSHAEIFSSTSLDEAKVQAKKDGKLVLIDFTATWCPPCKMMESTTWTNSDVQSWINENAIALQVDVDRDEKTARALNIRAMPTVVLFTPESGDKEFTREVGYQSAEQLLEWLKTAKGGKVGGRAGREKARADESAIWDRISKARQLQTSRQNAEALEEYIWLWNNLDQGNESFVEVRNKVVPAELKQLCAAYPAAKTKWIEIRDNAEKDGKQTDWFILNLMLDDNARTLAWFDKAKADPKQHELIIKNTSWLEPPLFASCRWADAASYLYPQPLGKINEIYKVAEGYKKPRDAHTEVAKDFDPFPSMITLVYGAYIGAGRDADAQKIADECIKLDDTPAMHESLDNMAKAMKTARAAQSKAQPAAAAPKATTKEAAGKPPAKAPAKAPAK